MPTGRQLETILGPVEMAVMVAVLTLLTSTLMVGGAVVASTFLGYHSFMNECAVGFSGVLFALKVVLQRLSPSGGYVRLMGFSVPVKYAFWAELVLIQLMVPQASFSGHLCGILAGGLYEHL